MHLSVLHTRGARVLLHLAAVTALSTGSLLVVGGAGHADTATRPDVYSGDSVASALHAQTDRDPALFPVSDPLHVEIPYATSSLDSSGGATASAATLFPGAGALGLRGLMCTFDSRACLPLPDYPLMATASYPTAPDAKTQTTQAPVDGGPFTVTPGVTSAHADPGRVEARTQAAGLDVAGAVSATSATSVSKQVFEGSTLVVTAESTVKGLDIAGGALHVDAVRSVAVSRVDGEQVLSTTATTTVTGATAGGTPVVIDTTGVHVAGAGDGGAVPSGANTVLAALKAAGVDVRLVAPTRSTKDGVAASSTGGVMVSFRRTVDRYTPGLPLPPGVPSVTYDGDYFGTVSVAGAGVSAYAFPALPQQPWQLPPPVVGQPAPPAAVAPVGSAVVAPPGGPAPSAGTPVGPTLAAPRHLGRPAIRLLGEDLSSARLKALALALLAYPALVLLLSPVRGRPRRRAGAQVPIR